MLLGMPGRTMRTMRLVGANGDQVELDIAGYQFPDIADEQWDSNWLNITTTATVDHRSWTSRDPSLLTMEVEELARWLEAVADGKEVDRELEFMEPNLAFQLDGISGAEIHLRVWFECESRPVWKPNPVADARDLAATLSVTATELGRAAEDLRGQLERFPTRVPLESG
jgi:hypothetical protein